ncbi:hypothetical protein MP228_001034 [Amoeboaphelidium protococcarum]|nr:hypothetical protein MP228_001034 [Amoeboaphelidium protococcarum]
MFAGYTAVASGDQEQNSQQQSSTNTLWSVISVKNRKWRQLPAATTFVVSLALFTDMLVYGIVIPVLPSILKDLNLAETNLGLLVGVYGLGLLIAAPAVGWVCDHYEGTPYHDMTRRWSMLAGLAGLGISTILFGFVDTDPSQSGLGLALLIIARFAQGVSGAVTWSVGLSLIADVYSTEVLGSAMGICMSAQVFGQLAGPPLGGFLYEFVGKVSPFLFSGALAIIDLVFRLWVKPQRIQKQNTVVAESTLVSPVSTDGGDAGDNNNNTLLRSSSVGAAASPQVIKISMIEMVRAPSLLLAFAATIAMSTAYSGVEPTLPLYLPIAFPPTSGVKMNQSMIGLLMVAIVVPNIILAVVAGWLSDRYSKKLVSGYSMVLTAISMPLIAIPKADNYGNHDVDRWGSGIWLQVLTLMVFGSFSAFAITPLLPEIGNYITARGGTSYTQVYALFNMAYSVGMLVGPIAAGFVYEWLGFFWCMFLFAVIVLIVGILQIVAGLGKTKYISINDSAGDENVRIVDTRVQSD